MLHRIPCNSYIDTGLKGWVMGPLLVSLLVHQQAFVFYVFLFSFFFLSLACWCTSRLLYLTCFFFLFSFFFFLSFWQHAIFTYFPKLDFDQTWPKWPERWPLLRHKQRWRQRSHRGHTGQKRGQKRVNFHQKRINSHRLRSIDTWLMHIYQLEPLYKSYGPKKSSGVIWGHRGQKWKRHSYSMKNMKIAPK